MDHQNEVFQQDLNKQERPGAVFFIQLLMKAPVPQPDKETLCAVMQKHLHDVECFWHDEKGAGFAAKKYLAQFKDASLPPQLMITSCTSFDGIVFWKHWWSCIQNAKRSISKIPGSCFLASAFGIIPSPGSIDLFFLQLMPVSLTFKIQTINWWIRLA